TEDTPRGAHPVDGPRALPTGKILTSKSYISKSRVNNNIDLDQYIIMPNYIHGIIIINNPAGNGRARSVNKTQFNHM
ncbi:MAG: hypothetical protein ACE5GG_03615, partial [Candidatus Omnitrophota bacterium]